MYEKLCDKINFNYGMFCLNVELGLLAEAIRMVCNGSEVVCNGSEAYTIVHPCVYRKCVTESFWWVRGMVDWECKWVVFVWWFAVSVKQIIWCSMVYKSEN